MKEQRPVPIKDALTQALKKIESQTAPAIHKEEIERIWEEVVGKDAARHSRPTQLKKNVLIINIDSPAWVYQLSNKKEELEKKISRAIKQKTPLRIRLRAGEV